MKNKEENKVLPRGFMIPNVENKEDYAYYKATILRTVPENTVLVCRNKFTGNVYALGSGLRYTAPWVESKLTSLSSKMMDLKGETYKTRDGIEVKINISLVIKIVDAVKYEINSQTPITELNNLTKDIVRIYIANTDLDDLYISNIDKNVVDKDKNFEEFQNKCGVKIEELYFKNIEMPKKIAEKYSEVKKAEKKLEASKIEAEEKEIRANAEALAIKMEGEAEASVKAKEITSMIEVLVDKGLSKEQIMDYLEKTVFAKDGTHVIANLNGTNIDSTNIGAMVAAASIIKSNDNDNDNIKEKNENNEKKDVKKRIKK